MTRRSARVLDVASAVAAGLLLAVLLVVLAPSAVVLRVGEPAGGVVPLMLSGVYGIEENYGRLMRWTTGTARLRWTGQFGVEPAAVVVSLAGFPGRQPDQVELQLDGWRSRHAVGEQYGEIRAALPHETRSPLDITLRSLTTRPPADPRDLGVRLEAVTIENLPIGRRLRATLTSGAVGVIAVGALAWLAGAWTAGSAASSRRRLRAAATVWGLTAVGLWAMAPTALREQPLPTIASLLVGLPCALLLARAGHRRTVAVAAGLVVTLQALVVVTWCASAFVDVPRWDIWDMVPMLQRQEAQGLTLADLWAPHNEHRPLVARAVVLANVAVSNWNHWNELWLLLALVAAHVLVLVAGIRGSGRSEPVGTLVAVAAIGTFIATPTQWENLLAGWQVALIAGALAISGAFVLLSGGRATWGRLAGAAGLVLIGTAGFGSCLLGWPVGAATFPLRRGRRWIAHLLVWTVVAVAVIVAYLSGLTPNPAHPPSAPVFRSLEATARVAYGACLALAMPVRYVPELFVIEPRDSGVWLVPAIGAAGVLVATVLLVLHLRQWRRQRTDAWLLPALLVAFSVGACVITAIGRVNFGMHALTASRYIAFSGLFWVGLALLLTVASPLRSPMLRMAGTALAVCIVVAGLRAWVDSLPCIDAHFVSGSIGREALLRGDVEAAAPTMFPAGPVLHERQEYLRRRQLSVFRPGAR